MTLVIGAFDEKLSPGVDCSGDEIFTVQGSAQECDINFIVNQYQRQGTMPSVDPLAATYGDAPSITYHEALNLVLMAQATFADVPAALRARFGNDPGAFVDFCLDEKNIDELRSLGLSNPAPAPEPDPVPAPVGDPAKPV